MRITSERFAAGLDTQGRGAAGRSRARHRAHRARAVRRRDRRRAQPARRARRRRSRARRRASPRSPPARAGRRAAAVHSARPRRRAGRRSSRRAGASRPRARTSRSRKAQFYPNVNIVAFAGSRRSACRTSSSARQRDRRRRPGDPPADLRRRAPEREPARPRTPTRTSPSATYNQAVIDAVHDVADAVVVDPRPRARSPPSRRARARPPTDAYNLAVIRYRAGLGNYLTVLTAQTQQLVQDRLDVDLKARAFELDVNLARALGGGYVDTSVERIASRRSRADDTPPHSQEHRMPQKPLAAPNAAQRTRRKLAGHRRRRVRGRSASPTSATGSSSCATSSAPTTPTCRAISCRSRRRWPAPSSSVNADDTDFVKAGTPLVTLDRADAEVGARAGAGRARADGARGALALHDQRDGLGQRRRCARPRSRARSADLAKAAGRSRAPAGARVLRRGQRRGAQPRAIRRVSNAQAALAAGAGRAGGRAAAARDQPVR